MIFWLVVGLCIAIVAVIALAIFVAVSLGRIVQHADRVHDEFVDQLEQVQARHDVQASRRDPDDWGIQQWHG